MDRCKPVLCPRCGHISARIAAVYENGAVADVLIWCEYCDEETPHEAEW